MIQHIYRTNVNAYFDKHRMHQSQPAAPPSASASASAPSRPTSSGSQSSSAPTRSSFQTIQNHLAKKVLSLPERKGIPAVSVHAYLRLLQLVLNKRHRLQEIGRANRLCTLDSTNVVEVDRTLRSGVHTSTKTEAMLVILSRQHARLLTDLVA